MIPVNYKVASRKAGFVKFDSKLRHVTEPNEVNSYNRRHDANFLSYFEDKDNKIVYGSKYSQPYPNVTIWQL